MVLTIRKNGTFVAANLDPISRGLISAPQMLCLAAAIPGKFKPTGALSLSPQPRPRRSRRPCRGGLRTRPAIPRTVYRVSRTRAVTHHTRRTAYALTPPAESEPPDALIAGEKGSENFVWI